MIRFDGPDGVRFLAPAHVVSVCDTPEGAVVSLTNGDRLTVNGVTAEALMGKLAGQQRPGVVAAHPVGNVPNLRIKG